METVPFRVSSVHSRKNGVAAAPPPPVSDGSLAATPRYRVITRSEVQTMIAEAVLKDRQQWSLRLGEEAKAKIAEARAELQQAILEIEKIRGREGELQREIAKLRAEKAQIETELAKLQSSGHGAESTHLPPLKEERETLSAFSQRFQVDALAARMNRIESLLAAHLIQDHRQTPPPELDGPDVDPRNGNGPIPGHPNHRRGRKPSK